MRTFQQPPPEIASDPDDPPRGPWPHPLKMLCLMAGVIALGVFVYGMFYRHLIAPAFGL